MCRPTSRSPCWRIGGSAGGRSACQMPCLLCSPPVLVLLLWPWPKPGLMRSHTRWPGARAPSWCSMSIEPALTGMPSATTLASVASVDQVGGEHDARVCPRRVRVAGGQRALDLAQRHRVHHHALLAHQAQQVHVGIGLLRIADGVEGPRSSAMRARMVAASYTHSGVPWCAPVRAAGRGRRGSCGLPAREVMMPV
jgi:hypothetical protein